MKSSKSIERPPTMLIRSLRPGEEPEAATVFQEAVLGNWRQPKPPLWESDDARLREHRLAIADLERMHAENADLVLVAEEDDQIVGMAATTVRDDHAHVTFVFVLPDFQTRGVGKALIAETTSALARIGVTRISLTASDDRRAWTRYLQMGLLPGPPIVSLATDAPRLPALEPDGARETPVDPADPAQLDLVDALDRRVKGATRRSDRLAWHAAGAREAIVHDATTGAPIGAYVVSRDHEHCRIGPVIADEAADVARIVRRSLAAAAALCEGAPVTWVADVPGQNGEALRVLLDAGFRPRSLLPWFANGPIGQWDRYILRSEDLL